MANAFWPFYLFRHPFTRSHPMFYSMIVNTRLRCVWNITYHLYSWLSSFVFSNEINYKNNELSSLFARRILRNEWLIFNPFWNSSKFCWSFTRVRQRLHFFDVRRNSTVVFWFPKEAPFLTNSDRHEDIIYRLCFPATISGEYW